VAYPSNFIGDEIGRKGGVLVSGSALLHLETGVYMTLVRSNVRS